MRTVLKSRCKSLLHRLGYEIRRIPLSQEAIAAMAGKDAAYYTEYATAWPIFAPWVGDHDFQEIYGDVKRFILGSPERAYMLISLAWYAKHLVGDFAECGVYKGGSALLLGRVLEDSNKKLSLFDSFQGLPKRNQEHGTGFQEGEFSTPADTAKQVLKDYWHMIELHEGWIPDTFCRLETTRYAFAHIDVDFYQSTLDCCAYFYPRLTAGGVLLFDEYGFPAGHGEKDAVDEYFADKPERPITLLTGQALVLKLP